MPGHKGDKGKSQKGKMSYEDPEEMMNKRMMPKKGKRKPKMKK